MLGALLKKMNMGCKLSAYNDKTLVKLDGFVIARGKRVTICAKCTKTSVCHHTKHRYIHTSAGHWYDTKKKYKWKIFGKYRLRRFVVRESKKIAD